jgi:chaperonin GroES
MSNVIQPLSDKIAILADVENKKTASGLVLPTEARKNTTQTGVVKAVGSGFLLDNGTRVPPTVTVGDRVAFSIHAGAELEVDGVTYILINEEQILAILK